MNISARNNICGCTVKIAGTSRGCKANSIESRASDQERFDRDEQGVPCDERVRVGNGMCIV